MGDGWQEQGGGKNDGSATSQHDTYAYCAGNGGASDGHIGASDGRIGASDGRIGASDGRMRLQTGVLGLQTGALHLVSQHPQQRKRFPRDLQPLTVAQAA